jgi:hypothetical protein
MSFKVSRQLLFLGALGIALAVAVVARRADDPAGTGQIRSNGRSATTAAATTQTPVADLRLDLLQGDSSELAPPTRNPFQFRAKPSPAPREQASAGRPQVVIAPPPIPQGPPPPPPIAMKYIGVLETAQGRVAVFRDSGGDIMNGKEGDIIDGRYRLLKIGVESADLAYVDGRGRQTIRLSGQ